MNHAAAQEALGEQWDDFAARLHAELEHLGGFPRVQAQIQNVAGSVVTVAGRDITGSAIATGDRSIAVAGSIFGSIYNVYQTPLGNPSLSEEGVKRILENYLNWVYKAYSKTRLYGLESLSTVQGRPMRQLKEIFVPITLRRFRPPRWADPEEMRFDRVAVVGYYSPIILIIGH